MFRRILEYVKVSFFTRGAKMSLRGLQNGHFRDFHGSFWHPLGSAPGASGPLARPSACHCSQLCVAATARQNRKTTRSAFQSADMRYLYVVTGETFQQRYTLLPESTKCKNSSSNRFKELRDTAAKRALIADRQQNITRNVRCL